MYGLRPTAGQYLYNIFEASTGVQPGCSHSLVGGGDRCTSETFVGAKHEYCPNVGGRLVQSLSVEVVLRYDSLRGTMRNEVCMPWYWPQAIHV